MTEKYRICKGCGLQKEISYFRSQISPKNNKTYFRWKCKKCEELYLVEYKKVWSKTKSGSRKLRDYHLRRVYGITIDEYEKISGNQNGKCAICNDKPKTRPLCVDHNHKSKKIRGLLCDPCNTALGKFKDSAYLLKEAIKYLEKMDKK